jgi:choline dehydrogenase-like flavoprotein
VQAKYNARKTLAVALATGRVDVLDQAVASRVHVGEDNRISHIEFKGYDDPASTSHTTGTVRGRIYVLAANPVENARLMLASGLPSSSGLMGRNLMDHAYLLTWALMPDVAGTFRGAVCTSGIDDLRGGAFRRRQAAFRYSIHNDGWGWATGSPYSDLTEMVDDQNLFGPALRHELVDKLSRQLLLDIMVELLPDPDNRVTVDPRYTDQLGNLRPILAYRPSDYTMAGMAYARRLTRRIYQRLGAEDCTSYDPLDPGYLTYEGEGYVIRGGNHWAGTHIMGDDRSTSVVDFRQRSWDHENLYLVGGGSMPTVGSSNTTLTLAALCFLTAEHMVADLRARASAVQPVSVSLPLPVPAAAASR